MHRIMKMKSTKCECEPCIFKLVIQFILFVQGLFAAATGNIGIITYSGSVELLHIRLNYLSWLIVIHAYIQLLAALICFSAVYKYCTTTFTKVVLFVVIWGAWLSWILIYSFIQVYYYEQKLTLIVSLVLIFDIVYVLLLFGAVFLLLTSICRAEISEEKSVKLLQNEQKEPEVI